MATAHSTPTHTSISPAPTMPLPWGIFVLCLIAYLFGGTASTLMATHLPTALPQLLGASATPEQISTVGTWINAAFLYGWMAGGLLTGPLADRIGRVRALALATGLCSLGMLATVVAPNEYALMMIRVLTGAGVGGVLVVSTVYLSEIWPAPSRPIALGILATAFPVGIVATGGLVSLFSNWRTAFQIGIVPLVVAFMIWGLLPESQLWQREHRQVSPQESSLFRATNRANLVSGAVIFGAVLIGLWGIFSWIPTWIQTLLPAGQSGQTERGLTMMLLGMGGILGGIASGFLVAKLGPRLTLLITFAGCILACSLLVLSNRVFSPLIYAEIALLSLFFGISQGSLSSYVPTLFPAAIRATATGFCFNIGRLFTATAVLFVGALTNALGGLGNALLVFSGAFLIAFIMIWFRK